MNAPDEPPVGAPSIGAQQARRCIDTYIDAWNEPQADKRRQMLAQAMTDDGAYADPARTDSRADLVECIGDVLDKEPGRRIVRTSEVDAHNQRTARDRARQRAAMTDRSHAGQDRRRSAWPQVVERPGATSCACGDARVGARRPIRHHRVERGGAPPRYRSSPAQSHRTWGTPTPIRRTTTDEESPRWAASSIDCVVCASCSSTSRRPVAMTVAPTVRLSMLSSSETPGRVCS